MNRDLEYWVATSAIPGVGTATFNYLLKHFKTLKKFWEASDQDIEKLKLDGRTREEILNFRKKVDPKVYLDTVYERGIKVTSIVERDYPSNLRQTLDAPAVLYYKEGSLHSSSLRVSQSSTFKGSFSQDDIAIAVVGSRLATPYGRQVTEKLVYDLVQAGLTIVSGLARGIDSVAHKTALEAGGRTIAVLGSGLDLIYPSENRGLAEQIIKNGAIVSEFPLGFGIKPSNFPARNRIVSGLSLGVLVTEAAANSGSLITAGHAAEQGREVFAVPGPINSRMSEGTNNLIKEGVHPVSNASDILQVLNIERRQGRLATNDKRLMTTKNLTKDEKKILDLLDGQSKHIDVIARESGLAIDKVSSALSVLEIKGFVKNYGSGIWGV